MTFTWKTAMRSCGKCGGYVPNSTPGWTKHPILKMVCPACSAQRKQKNEATQGK